MAPRAIAGASTAMLTLRIALLTMVSLPWVGGIVGVLPRPLTEDVVLSGDEIDRLRVKRRLLW
ncbi:hypothetical protein GCM10010252_72060 [Streptomyces aureoverticillatus]|nr:hypothetical protein GCM10010252_72060 [Streptomyces aureoverticillatus]